MYNKKTIRRMLQQIDQNDQNGVKHTLEPAYHEQSVWLSTWLLVFPSPFTLNHSLQYSPLRAFLPYDAPQTC